MENINLGLQNLKNELKLGKELAKQLKNHLISPSSSNETRELLLNKIIISYDKALHMLHPHVVAAAAEGGGGGGIITFESPVHRPRSLSLSPRSEDSDRELNRNHHHNSTETPKKRKNMPRWTKHVQVSPGNGLEGPLDDGCNWRKYGQKDILGAKYPRGYYRCTLRHLQGCLATKQVQRTDDDPTVFEITYRGTHTCNQSTLAQNTHPLNQEPASSGVQKPMSPPPPLKNQQQETLLSFQTSLKVRTENLEDRDFADLPLIDDSVLNFRSSSFGTFFGTSHVIDNDFGGNACPSLMDKDLVTATTTPTTTTTSSTNTTTVGVEFPIGQMEFPPNFPFHDNLGFFS